MSVSGMLLGRVRLGSAEARLGRLAIDAWVPFTTSARRIEIDLAKPDVQKTKQAIAAILGSPGTLPSAFLPGRRERFAIKTDQPGPVTRPKFSIATIAYTPGRRPPPLLVQVDPQAEQRTRTHEQLVANILNSLIRQGVLLRADDLEWSYGYNPTNLTNWAMTPPTTLEEALDRLAAAIVAKTGGTI